MATLEQACLPMNGINPIEVKDIEGIQEKMRISHGLVGYPTDSKSNEERLAGLMSWNDLWGLGYLNSGKKLVVVITMTWSKKTR